MGKSTPSAPPPPDPNQVINQQTGSNINTAIGNAWLNNTNQTTPWGSLTYNQIGSRDVGNGYSVPQFEATQTLSPTGQKVFDLGSSYIDRIRDATKTPFNYAGLPDAPVYDENFRQNRLDTILQRAQAQLDRSRPAFDLRPSPPPITSGETRTARCRT